MTKYGKIDAAPSQSAGVNDLMGGEEVLGVELPGLETQAKSDADKVRKATKRLIMINNQEGPGGDQAVFVAVNGMGYNIPREKQVLVPEPVVQVLENAIESTYQRDQSNGQDFGPVVERKRKRFPFQVLS